MSSSRPAFANLVSLRPEPSQNVRNSAYTICLGNPSVSVYGQDLKQLRGLRVCTDLTALRALFCIICRKFSKSGGMSCKFLKIFV
jgi:hypothetical protein